MNDKQKEYFNTVFYCFMVFVYVYCFVRSMLVKEYSVAIVQVIMAYATLHVLIFKGKELK